MGGLFLNMLGLLCLWLNQHLGGQVVLLFLDMFFFGLALTSVINVLITFVILNFPKRTGAGITALFAVLSGGVMLAPLLLGLFNQLGIDEAIFPLLMLLSVGAIWFVEKKMYDPPYPLHLRHLRSDSLIWKELHYRLGFFFIAVTAYGALETSFSMWGLSVLSQHLKQAAALETIPIFYLFMIIGQILLLVPLYLYSPEKIFYGVLLLAAFSLYFLFHQDSLFGFITTLASGGIGCAAIFPILISMMEKELAHVARRKYILPYIETGVSVLLAGYYIGNAFNDLWIDSIQELGKTPHFNMAIGLGLAICLGLITLGLQVTAPSEIRGVK